MRIKTNEKSLRLLLSLTVICSVKFAKFQNLIRFLFDRGVSHSELLLRFLESAGVIIDGVIFSSVELVLDISSNDLELSY